HRRERRNRGAVLNEPDTKTSYLDLPLGRFLDLTASGEPAPGGGAAAAVAVSLAAALSGMAARLSTGQLPEAEEMLERAEALKERAAPLAQADAAAYGRVIEAQREGGDVKATLSAAADVPLEIAEIGAEVAEIAVRLVEHGNPNLRGDAITAVLLDEAGTRAAVALVEINLSAAGVGDDRLDRARKLAQSSTVARNAAEGGT
ncbi:MAG: cyclodeaminase/cyclohydrolase family protein, partial [Rubrobacteraceae bacterium]